MAWFEEFQATTLAWCQKSVPSGAVHGCAPPPSWPFAFHSLPPHPPQEGKHLARLASLALPETVGHLVVASGVPVVWPAVRVVGSVALRLPRLRAGLDWWRFRRTPRKLAARSGWFGGGALLVCSAHRGTPWLPNRPFPLFPWPALVPHAGATFREARHGYRLYVQALNDDPESAQEGRCVVAFGGLEGRS